MTRCCNATYCATPQLHDGSTCQLPVQVGTMPYQHCPCGWDHFSPAPAHSLVVIWATFIAATGIATRGACCHGPGCGAYAESLQDIRHSAACLARTQAATEATRVNVSTK